MKKHITRLLAFTATVAMILNLFGLNLGFAAADEGSNEKKWSFDSATDLNDFKSYYWSRSGGYVKESSISQSFKHTGGKLVRDASTRPYKHNGEGKFENISALTLNDPTFRNFDLTYKFKKTSDGSYSKNMFIGMREKTPGQVVNGREWESGVQLNGTYIPALNLRTESGKMVFMNGGKGVDFENTGYTNDFNTVRVRLVENTLSVWMNGNQIASNVTVADGQNQCGYISFYFANSFGEIDEIGIKRLDAKGNEINFVPDVTFAAAPSVIPMGVAAEELIKQLPKRVKAVYSGYEVPVDIDGWKCADYDPTKAGSYNFTASVVGLASYFSNLSVSMTVKISNEVVKYTLNDANQINSAFDSHYSGNILQSSAVKTKFEEKWDVTSDGIVRKPSENANAASESANMAILTYKKAKLGNFVLTVTYKQGSDSTAKAPIVGFGSETTGKFANLAGGGIAAYVSADGKLKLWSNKFSTSGDYRLSYDIAEYNASAEHQLKVIVGSTKASYYVDGKFVASYVLKDYKNGYIYLALGSNRGSFRNLEISPLMGIQSVGAVKDTSVPLNTSPDAAKAKLPKSVEVTLEDGSKTNYDILEWTSSTYNPAYSGKYKFTGIIKADSSVNPADLNAYAVVEVSEVYDPDITRKYFFDNADDLDDFTAYYASEANPNVKGSGFKATDWRENWALTDGMLKKLYNGNSDDTKNIAMLVLNKQKYKNFELTVDFKQGEETYRWAMVGFGAKKMGEFALSEDGGRVHYLQQEGTVSGWGREFVTGWEYHEVYSGLENYERNAIHRMKLTVIGKKVTIKIDDYEPVITDAPADYNGGYIYLAVNSNSALFDNLTVIDYDVKDRKIEKVSANKKVVYDHNDKFAEYELPEIADVVCDDGRTYPMAVEWSCPDFRSNIPGLYKYTGKIILPSGKFSNPKRLSGYLELEVIVDYDPNTSVKYYFDTPAELDDFVCYYTPTTGNDGLKKVPVSEQWEINDSGRIVRINQDFEQKEWSEEFAATKLSTLVWNAKELENFEIEVDYKQGTNTWLWAMAMFGIKDPTKWIMNYTGTDSGEMTGVGGYACYAQQEGTATMWGDFSKGYRVLANLPGVVNYNRGEVNHMKIKVVNGLIKLYINEATEPLAVEARTHDTKGKIALACGMNLAEFDNLKITALDSNGTPANIGMSNFVNGGGKTNGNNGSSAPTTGDTVAAIIEKAALVLGISAVFIFGFWGGNVLKKKKS